MEEQIPSFSKMEEQIRSLERSISLLVHMFGEEGDSWRKKFEQLRGETASKLEVTAGQLARLEVLMEKLYEASTSSTQVQVARGNTPDEYRHSPPLLLLSPERIRSGGSLSSTQVQVARGNTPEEYRHSPPLLLLSPERIGSGGSLSRSGGNATPEKIKCQKRVRPDDQDIDPRQFRENRIKFLNALKEQGKDPYCHDFHDRISHTKYAKRYKTDSRVDYHDGSVTDGIAGRIMAKRKNGSNLYFYDLHSEGCKIQIMADIRLSELTNTEFSDLHSNIKRGDIVGVHGHPGKDNAGELTISATKIHLLSFCFHPLPRPKLNANPTSRVEWTPGNPRCPQSYVLNQDTRWRYRFLDLMLNPDIREIFYTRANIIRCIRSFLDDLGFLEVETSIMSTSFGGGVARLRISPKLKLKELLVGGLERVYEIGKQFHLEGTDSTHHPEFTSCEFYMAFANYSDLLGLTENLLSGIVKELTGGYKVKFHANGFDKEPIEIDFTPPFRKLEMIEELEKVADLNIPSDLSSEKANEYLVATCHKVGVRCPAPQTTARLLDKLVGHFLEGSCVNPTFIMHHPAIMSAMARSHPSKPSLTERFELFICKHEICNAYTELSNPVEQSWRFTEQLKAREMGDKEVAGSDEFSLLSLEHGLPPAARWGIDVILFPVMRGQGGGDFQATDQGDSEDKKQKRNVRDKEFRSDDRGQNILDQQMRMYKRQMQCRSDIDRFSAPLLAIYESLIPLEEEQAKQKQLMTLLKKLVNKEWPEARLFLYGSCANSFGVSKSDIDVCLEFGEANVDKSKVLLKLASILQSNDLENVQALTRARVPIVKFMDPVTGIPCDICVNNVLAVVNTKLLREYAKIDSRLRQLAFIVKHWAKSRAVNKTFQGTLSSYAYVLMCIHFLQQRRPAILPCLQAMEPTYSFIVDDLQCSFFDEIDQIRGFGSSNTESIANLVWGFFNYWAYQHDYENNVISVRTGTIISKRDTDWTRRVDNDRHLICIEDPFKTSHDLGRVVDKHSIRVLREEFERAAKIMQEDANPCVTLFEPYVSARSISQ